MKGRSGRFGIKLRNVPWIAQDIGLARVAFACKCTRAGSQIAESSPLESVSPIRTWFRRESLGFRTEQNNHLMKTLWKSEAIKFCFHVFHWDSSAGAFHFWRMFQILSMQFITRMDSSSTHRRTANQQTQNNKRNQKTSLENVA